ncbi:MAG: flagellar GTP-binding protein, partial [Isosphaeraceae bacterium]
MGVTRTYRAATMREALALVRRDLGGDAVILNTREVRRRRLFGLGARDLVEVLASDGQAATVSVQMREGTAAPTGFGDELKRLHAMVEALSQQGRVDHLLPELPGEVVPAYAQLIEAGVTEVLARRLARHVAERLEPEDAGRPDRLREILLEAVEACVPVAPPTAVVPGTRRVVALVGPT